MLKTLLRLSALIALAHLCPAQVANAASPDILGKWTVENVLCSACGNRTPTEKGSVIDFASTAIYNPLSENCNQAPDYSRLQKMPGAHAAARFGKQWPKPLRRAASKQAEVRYGFITCGGVNFMQVVLFSTRRAFYFFEGGLVFDLRRANP